MPNHRKSETLVALRLDYRPPFDFGAIASFLASRAIPGVERAGADGYSRTVANGKVVGSVRVRPVPGRNELACSADPPLAVLPQDTPRRLRDLFDLDADPAEIHRVLRRDRQLTPLIDARPGLRVPGAWDPFEVAVRAIVGQQVSVKAATSMMGSIARRFGTIADTAVLFPAAESLARVDPAELPMPGTRAAAGRELARAVAEGRVRFDSGDRDALREALLSIRGIGPWTAQYIAMRAAGDRDAFPAGDLVLRRVAARYLGITGEQALRARAERWRPWRAYAAMHLWSLAGTVNARGAGTPERTATGPNGPTRPKRSPGGAKRT